MTNHHKEIQFIDGAIEGLSTLLFDTVVSEDNDLITPGADFFKPEQMNYSLESIKVLEKYLISLKHDELNDEDYMCVVLRTGAYLGEVIRRNSKNEEWHWVDHETALTLDPSLAEFGKQLGFVANLYCAEGDLIFPLAKVEKFMSDPEGDSLSFYSDVILHLAEMPD